MRRLINSMVIFTFVMIAGLAMSTVEVQASENGYTDEYGVLHYTGGDSLSADEKEAIQDQQFRDAFAEEAASSSTTTQPTPKTNNSGSTSQKTSSAPKYTEAEIEAAWSETGRTDATCSKDGVITYKNSLTGKTKTEAIPATGKHSYALSEHVDSTCVNNGYDTYTCTVCGDSYVTPITELANHTYEVSTIDATCTTDGSATYTCSVCGDVKTETVSATGHTEGNAVTTKKAGLFSEGTQTINCSECGELLSTEVIPQTFPISLAGLLVLAIGMTAVLTGIAIHIKRK